MATTALLLGSVRGLAAQAGLSSPGSPGTWSVAAGDYYLDDSTTSLSLIDTFVAALTSAGADTPAGFITEGLRVRLTFGSTVAVVFTDTTLRDLLGFTGNLSGASAYTATNVSPLLWAPGKTESPLRDVLGGAGEERYVGSVKLTPTLATSVTHHTFRRNTFLWRNVASARYRSSSEANGEYHTWFDEVLRKAASFKLYRNVTESSGSTTAADLTNGTLGPFAFAGGDRREFGPGFTRSEGFQWTDKFHMVELPVRSVEEYS